MDRHVIANMGAPGSMYRHGGSRPHHFGENSGCPAKALRTCFIGGIGER
jgi:hypothetical protein